MSAILRECLFVLAMLVVWSLVYSLLLPRLISAGARIGHPPGEGPATLEGIRYGTWIAVNALTAFCSLLVYSTLTQTLAIALLYVMFLTGLGVGLVYALLKDFNLGPLNPLGRDPEIAFGAGAGWLVGMLLAAVVLPRVSF